jgi:hypothetical protein
MRESIRPCRAALRVTGAEVGGVVARGFEQRLAGGSRPPALLEIGLVGFYEEFFAPDG